MCVGLLLSGASCGDDAVATETETETETVGPTTTVGETETTEGTTGTGTTVGTISTSEGTTETTLPTTTTVVETTGTTGATETETGGTTTGVTVCDGPDALCYEQAQRLLDGTPVGAIVLADLDGEALHDLVVGLDSGFQILPHDGAKFTLGPLVSTGAAVLALVVEDFNGDGQNDIAVARYGDGDVQIYLNNDGLFQLESTTAVGEFPRAMISADLDADLDVDLVVANEGSGDLSLLFGTGAGALAVGPTKSAGSAPLGLALGQFGGSAAQDLLVANFGGGAVGYYPGENGDFGPETGAVMIAGPRAVTVGLFDDDSFLDFAVAGEGNDAVGVALGTGAGVFLEFGLYEAGLDPRAIASADFDGDGNLDVVVANRGGDDVTILRGDGMGALLPPEVVSQAFEPSSLALGQLNPNVDAIPDIVIGSDGAIEGGVTVLASDPS